MKLLNISDNGRDIFVCAGPSILRFSLNDNTQTLYRLEQAVDSPIVCMCITDEYVFGGFNSKHVCCWAASSGEVLGWHIMKKRPMTLAHSRVLIKTDTQEPEKDILVAADRAGEVWLLGAPLMKSSQCVAGHTASVITDMLLSSDHKLLITADRDEKIRVSQFPQTCIIQSYCLGHRSVVASVSSYTIPNTPVSAHMLASSSWDHQICLWELQSGKCCGRLDLSLEHGVAATEITPDENEQEAEEEGDEAEDKTYDEKQAGNYPIRLIAHALPSLTSDPAGELERVLLLVLLRGMAVVNTYVASRRKNTLSDCQDYSFSKLSSWTAPALPVDMVVLSSQGDAVQVAVLLSKPAYMSVISVSTGSSSSLSTPTDGPAIAVKEGEDERWTRWFRDALSAMQPGGATFTQESSIGDDEGQGNGNILLKHTLDKPFTKLTGVQLEDGQAPTGKRGRKRPIDTLTGADREAALEALNNPAKKGERK